MPARQAEGVAMISVFDLFSIGVGPSSSHTVGPMRAAADFAASVGDDPRVVRVHVGLYGSLGATGRGHSSDRAVVLGLEGERPKTVDPGVVVPRSDSAFASGRLLLGGTHPVAFDVEMIGDRSLPRHPNGMRFAALDDTGTVVKETTSYSIGGGFVVGDEPVRAAETDVPQPFRTAAELLARCGETGLPISGVMRVDEEAVRSPDEVSAGLRRIWSAMDDCINSGLHAEGTLPGPLRVPRRAGALNARLARSPSDDPLRHVDWVTAFALAVNEENAAGGRIVTAPTNGAAGIVPAVLAYYMRFVPGAQVGDCERFLLTAGAIAVLFKENASISGAEVGCQGEVGSACSMAAGALCELLGGTPAQVENAAEIGMEHNLGLTCDPIGGLVQIPCIERNAMAAVKAITAARIALNHDGHHVVSLDRVIATMRETGADMSDKYKETSRGGLAVNIIEC
ncbi:L-serine ammonia-lyase [Gordonia malaquae]|uniref:L-serine ammonia-lyase n=2 Tax=Gordonia malaquae TaxID=410332 RepID=UPI003019392F